MRVPATPSLGLHRYREVVSSYARALPSERDAGDVFLDEFRAAAALVRLGAANRVVLCNYPDTLPFGDVRELGASLGVVVDPIVRIAGNGIDLGVRRSTRGDA